MKWNLNTGNLLIYGSVLTLLFIFSLIFSFIKEDLLLVTKDYYEEEVTYDIHKQELKNAELQGDLIKAEKNGNAVVLTIPDFIAKDFLKGEVIAYFPSWPSNDQVFPLSKNDTGQFKIEVANTRNVPYTLKVKFSDSSKSYYKIFQM